VREAARNVAFSRELTKLLNRRFEGAIRIVGRAETPEELVAAWQKLRDGGQIAAAYWALMSATSVPHGIKKRVFGEVHMLSHLHGQGANELASRLAIAERRLAELEARLHRTEAAKQAALIERDQSRLGPVAALRRPPIRTPGEDAEASPARLEKRLRKCERALVVARARARQAEAELASRRGAIPYRRVIRGSADVAAPPVAMAASPPPTSRAPSRVLYLGGRASIVPHLREVAEQHAADVLHHDGGLEDNPHRIEDLVSRCDAVVCPVDCISHGACRLAKALCRRMNKPFIPLPSASRSGFDRALSRLATAGRPDAPKARM
jgi:hypothetical protein